MLLTTAYLTGYTQDSLRLVPVRAWQLSRLIADAQTLRVCDSVVMAQRVAIEKADTLIANLEAQVLVLKSQNETNSQINTSWQQAFARQQAICAGSVKTARKRGRKEGLVAGLALALMILK